MNDARTKQVGDIEALLAERRKYEQWIAQLDARKESTPGHVFVKVHGDYTSRLEAAQQKLSSEAGAVRTLVTELEEALAKQRLQVDERTDERAEAELRASVGEFAGKEWEKLKAKLDSAIAELSGASDGIQRELDTLRALLNEAEPAAAAPPPVVEKQDIDDIAFLRSVLGRSTPYSSTPAGARATGGEGAPAAKRTPDGIGSPIAEAVTAPKPVPASEPPSAADVPRGAAGIRAASAAGAPARRPGAGLFAAAETAAPSPGPRANDDGPGRPAGAFGQPTARAGEGAKSLKCQECGTLNFPTEWYCERCGGELAAF